MIKKLTIDSDLDDLAQPCADGVRGLAQVPPLVLLRHLRQEQGAVGELLDARGAEEVAVGPRGASCRQGCLREREE